MKIRGVDFVLYNVSDYAKSVSFYKDVLGLKLIDEYGGFWAEFEAGMATIAISTHGPIPEKNYKGGATIALAVENVKSALEELKSKGVNALWGPKETGVCFMAAIADPDGNRIMLHERKDGTAG